MVIKDSEYGPQFDRSDGTVGEIQLVRRWVLVHGPEGRMFTPRQGSYTRATREEAEHYRREIAEGNPANLVPDDLRVEEWWCWPSHFDPKAPTLDKGRSKPIGSES